MTRSSAPEVALVWFFAAVLFSSITTASLITKHWFTPRIEHRLDMEGPGQ